MPANTKPATLTARNGQVVNAVKPSMARRNNRNALKWLCPWARASGT